MFFWIKVILCFWMYLLVVLNNSYSREEGMIFPEVLTTSSSRAAGNHIQKSSLQTLSACDPIPSRIVEKKRGTKKWSVISFLRSLYTTNRKVVALEEDKVLERAMFQSEEKELDSGAPYFYSSVSMSRDHTGDVLSELDGYSESVPRILTPNRSAKSAVYRIFIAGGGGLGCFVAHILNKISGDGVIFDIYIGEKGEDIIDQSTFSLASIVHTGYEYLHCEKTIAACQMGSKLWRAIWGDFYSNKRMQGTLFARDIDAPEDFNLANQKAAYQKGKSLSREIMLSYSGESDLDNVTHMNLGSDSHDDILPETMQKTFGVLTTGKYSRDDLSMNILNRNHHLKKQIENSPHITILKRFELLRISPGTEKRFNIEGSNTENPIGEFDYVILTPWDQVRKILEESVEGKGAMSALPEFIIEKRYMALVSTKGLGEMNMQVMTQGAGCMLSQVNEDMANAYECTEGASYPGDIDDAMIHGENIIKGLERRLGLEKGVTLLGVRSVNIVRSDHNLHTRNNVPPSIIPADVPNIGGVITAVAMKATLVPAVAFQTADMLVSQLPDSPHKRNMLKKLRDIVPNNECLYTGKPLPEDFIIDTHTKPTKRELLEETLIYMKNFELTESGRDLQKSYSAELDACDSPQRTRSSTIQTPSSPILTCTPPTMRRAVSDGESLELFYSPARKMSIRAASAKFNAMMSPESSYSGRSTLIFPPMDLLSAETSIFSTDDETELNSYEMSSAHSFSLEVDCSSTLI